MNNNNEYTNTNLTKAPLKKKGSTGNKEDETGTNTISAYTKSTNLFSPASDTCSGVKQKVHPTTEVAVLIDTEDITEVVDAAVLSKNNPGDGEKAKAEIIKANQYEQTLFEIVLRQHPRRSSPIWKFNYFKELLINRQGLRMKKTNNT
jgi:hypothetical protein